MIALVDGNNFYVSCERIFDLRLEGRAVAVLSNNDGCVISRSNELKAAGIKMGEPYFQLKARQAELGIVFKSSNYELYGDISRRVISVLGEFSPQVHQYSIDEAFLEFQPAPSVDVLTWGKKVRAAVLQWVGIPCGVGLAPTKTLAKIANHLGKHCSDGVRQVSPGQREPLEVTPVEEVWGVGRRFAVRLERMGIRNAWQLAQAEPAEIRRRFGVILARTVLELQGTSAVPDDDEEAAPQSITVSRAFGRPIVKLCEMQEAIANYTAKAAVKLRERRQCVSGINLFLQICAEGGAEWSSGGFVGTTVLLARPSSHTATLLDAVVPQVERLFVAGTRYRKAGVLFFGLEPFSALPRELFEPDSEMREHREAALDAAVDAVNHKYGRGAVFHLAEGISRPWAMHRSLLTPSYTTNWNDLLTVK